MKLRKEANSDKLNLAQKIELKNQANEADKVLRKLRMVSFDIEDEINARIASELNPKSPVLTTSQRIQV